MAIGDKIIYNQGADQGDATISVKAPGKEVADVTHKYNLDATAVSGKDLTLKHFEIDKETGQAKTTEITLKSGAVNPAGLVGSIAKFTTYKIGDVARDELQNVINYLERNGEATAMIQLSRVAARASASWYPPMLTAMNVVAAIEGLAPTTP